MLGICIFDVAVNSLYMGWLNDSNNQQLLNFVTQSFDRSFGLGIFVGFLQ